jgi:hypothetical protein
MRTAIRKALASTLLAVALTAGGVATSATASTVGGVATSAEASATTPSVVVQPEVAYVWTVHSDGFWTLGTCNTYAFGVMYSHPEYRDYECEPDPRPAYAGKWVFWVYAPDGYN